MKSDEIDRRDMIKTIALGSVTILPVLRLVESGATAAQAAAYSPKLFSPGEMELTATLAELIIPQTDTPGARAARVQELIDLTLSEETQDVQKRFREGLAWVDQRSRRLHSLDFLRLTAGQQTAILTSMASPNNAGHVFFRELRERTVFAYYTSEIGIHQELNYQGHQVLDHWPGCPHADHHGDSD
jgi:Gluconate 2-dehydrogenase subunit 3